MFSNTPYCIDTDGNEKPIGIPIIDAQHAGLFDTFARLQRSKTDDDLSEVLTKLGNQIEHHFSTEEAQMVSMGIPADMLEAHCEAHQAILEEIADMHWRAMHGNKRPLDEVVAMVASWIVDHLAEFDVKLRQYANS